MDSQFEDFHFVGYIKKGHIGSQFIPFFEPKDIILLLLKTQPELLFRPCVRKTDFFKVNQIVKITKAQSAKFIRKVTHRISWLSQPPGILLKSQPS
jgi:hypothetical protein